MWYKKCIPLDEKHLHSRSTYGYHPKTFLLLCFLIPLYVRLADGLIARIEAGELAPGEQLPAERELSDSLGVNRMT
jgi:hypothetical protein